MIKLLSFSKCQKNVKKNIDTNKDIAVGLMPISDDSVNFVCDLKNRRGGKGQMILEGTNRPHGMGMGVLWRH